jgi:hypothetical protein
MVFALIYPWSLVSEMHTFGWKILKERDYSEYLHTDNSIILNLIVSK